jgi:energy-coupling factor transporter transmembrane protein EcfT
MKKKYAYWNWFAIAAIALIYLIFYTLKKIELKFNWDGDFLLFTFSFIGFIWLFFRAGIENEVLTREQEDNQTMKSKPEYALFEWVRECLLDYMENRKPRKQNLISAIQMRLLQYDENVEYSHKYKKLIHVSEISEINGYIDESIRIFKGMDGSPTINDEMEQSCMAFVLTNACLFDLKKKD